MTVRLERDGIVARLILDRPEVGNAVDPPLADALAALAERCAADPGIRCVVLTGAGRMFCSGGDMARLAAAGDDAPAFLRALADTLHRAILTLMAMPKPLVVLVNGPAAGAGLSLSLIGDIVLAARSAHFTAAYGNVGLTPDGGMSWLLPRIVGLRRAQTMILANTRIGADEAAAIGLVTQVVDDAELEAEGMRLATRLAAAPVTAIGKARALLLDGAASTLAEQLDREAGLIAIAAGGAESREGVLAFVDRRRPDFLSIAG